MGLLDRWLKRVLDEPAAEVAEPRYPSSPPLVGREAEVPDVERGGDPLDNLLEDARARLTLDERGRRFAASPDFLSSLATLDRGGRSRAADQLLADALLVTPDIGLRRRLAERFLHRGDHHEAKVLLHELRVHDEHALWAMTALAELAEAEGEDEAALTWYERVLAVDISCAQPKARARRLRADREGKGNRRAQSALTRFLGARAAGSRYAVLEEIGRGGAATVFRARDRVLDREVALKIFHPRGKAQERRERLVREARIAGAFDHPHIVPILDVDKERDLLVMMLCDSGSLRQRLSRGRVPLAEAAEVGSILLRTLADIHEAGRLHLDIKPSNLLIHEERVLICDFGTAGLVELGAAAGTRAYMAPEQRSRGEASPAADLWAAGLLIFECITGHLPPGVERGQPRVELAELAPGPQRRAIEAAIGELVALDPRARPRDGRAAAQRLLESAALPATEKDGAHLLAHLESLARREGEATVERLFRHPLVVALRPPG